MSNLIKRKLTTRNIYIGTIVFAVFTLFVVCFSPGIQGNDFWWHVKVGEWIVENNTVPNQDVFSWYGIANGLKWNAHEWLSDVIFYYILSGAGEFGVYLFSVFAAFAMMILIWREVKPYAYKNMFFTGIFFCVLPFILKSFFYGRPHVFSFFLLFFELKILYNFIENPKSKSIYFIPLISCLWSNLHGGSSNLSYILCFVFLVAGLLPENIGRLKSVRLDRKSFLKLLLVTIVSVFSIVINPSGFDMVTYPYVNMGDALMLSVINEWAAPDAKKVFQLFFYFAPILMMTVGFFTEQKKIRVIDVFIMLIFMLLFFRSVRFIMLWFIAAAFYAFRYMPEFELSFIKKGIKVCLCVFAVLLCAGLFGSSVGSFKEAYAEQKLIKTVLDDEMISFVQEEAPERLYNDYNYGEALIYNDIKVFYDARADIYAADHILADGISLMNLKQMNDSAGLSYVDPDALINQYGFDSILIDQGRPLYGYLLKFPERYELLCEIGNAAYFRVSSTANN